MNTICKVLVGTLLLIAKDAFAIAPRPVPPRPEGETTILWLLFAIAFGLPLVLKFILIKRHLRSETSTFEFLIYFLKSTLIKQLFMSGLLLLAFDFLYLPGLTIYNYLLAFLVISTIFIFVGKLLYGLERNAFELNPSYKYPRKHFFKAYIAGMLLFISLLCVFNYAWSQPNGWVTAVIAATKGDTAAQFQLGQLTNDPKWYISAAKKDYPGAKDALVNFYQLSLMGQHRRPDEKNWKKELGEFEKPLTSKQISETKTVVKQMLLRERPSFLICAQQCSLEETGQCLKIPQKQISDEAQNSFELCAELCVQFMECRDAARGAHTVEKKCADFPACFRYP